MSVLRKNLKKGGGVFVVIVVVVDGDCFGVGGLLSLCRLC